MPVIDQTDAITERVSRVASHFNDRLTSGSYQKESIFDVHFPVWISERKRGVYIITHISTV